MYDASLALEVAFEFNALNVLPAGEASANVRSGDGEAAEESNQSGGNKNEVRYKSSLRHLVIGSPRLRHIGYHSVVILFGAAAVVSLNSGDGYYTPLDSGSETEDND